MTKRRIDMKKKYNIEVDCAICAQKMEDAAGKISGIKSVVVSFMAQKITVEFEDGADEKAIMTDVLKACKKIEKDCEIEF